MDINNNTKKILLRIFEDPIRSDVKWADVEKLFYAVGAEVTQGSGSRVRIALNGVRAVFHKPHPQPHIEKGALKSVRKFLKGANIHVGI